MSRAVLSIVFAILPAFSLAQDTNPPAAAPAASPAHATDPASLAAPKPAPDAKPPSAVPVDEKTYQIGPEDIIAISVWEQPQLSTSCTVRADGMITVPLIDEIKAAGLTPLELRQQIAEKLSANAINDPQVTVSLVGAHSRRYYISGQLKAPGAHDLVLPTRVLEAIISAGGFADFADKKHIVIVRGTQRLKFNYLEVMKGKNLEQNIFLESGDMIVVK